MKKQRRGMDVAIAAPYKPTPSASIQLGQKFGLPSVDVGQDVTITVTGKVRGIRADEYGKSLDLTIARFKAKSPSGLKDEMEALKESRRL